MTPKERLRARIAPVKPPEPQIDTRAQYMQSEMLNSMRGMEAATHSLRREIEAMHYDLRNLSGPMFALPGIMDRNCSATFGLAPVLMNIEKNTQPFKRKKKCRKTR